MRLTKEMWLELSDRKSITDKIIYLKSKTFNSKEIMKELNIDNKSKYYYYLHCEDKDFHLKRKLSADKHYKKITEKPYHSLIFKLNKFKNKNRNPPVIDYNYLDVIKKLSDKPICYLTGRSIDLNDGKSYHLDHIIPASKGGTNELDNLQIACKYANYAKNDLSQNELFKLCIDILKHNQIKLEIDF